MGIAEKKADKRKRLMKAAYECFSEDGPWDATINDICKKAGVAKGTFYLYFNNKEELYLSLVDIISNDICNEIEREIRVKKCTALREMIFTAIDKYVEIMATNSSLQRFMRGQMKWPGLNSYSGLIMRLRDTAGGLDSDKEDTEKLLKKLLSVLSMTGSVLFSAVDSGCPDDPDKCVELIREIVSDIIDKHAKPESV